MKKMTDSELKQKLGDSYFAPVGLYDKTKDMPFLGSVSCNIEEMDAGSWQEIIIDYELAYTLGSYGISIPEFIRESTTVMIFHVY